MQGVPKEQPYSSTCELSTIIGTVKSSFRRHFKMRNFDCKPPKQDLQELTNLRAEKLVEICKIYKVIVFVTKNEHSSVIFTASKKTNQFRLFDKTDLEKNYVKYLVQLIPDDRAVDSEFYYCQLERVYEVSRVCYSGVLNRHYNAPAYRSRLTQEKSQEVDEVNVSPHLTYSPEIAP